jgi:hypothetical protein
MRSTWPHCVAGLGTQPTIDACFACRQSCPLPSATCSTGDRACRSLSPRFTSGCQAARASPNPSIHIGQPSTVPVAVMPPSRPRIPPARPANRSSVPVGAPPKLDNPATWRVPALKSPKHRGPLPIAVAARSPQRRRTSGRERCNPRRSGGRRRCCTRTSAHTPAHSA